MQRMRHFSVAYDTRDRRLFKIFPCKCGKVEVSARGVDSFAIFKGDNFVEDLLQEEINPTVEYYPEDYLTLPGEIWGMMEKAEELGNKINDTNKPGEYYSDISEGMVTLELSGLSDNGEKLTITASGRFSTNTAGIQRIPRKSSTASKNLWNGSLISKKRY